jgi:signal transduction histidine kinase
MSHELLTPLNSAILGLKLSMSKLGFSEDDVDIRETITDANESLTRAVEILQNLSHQYNLESGTLELKRQLDVPVIPLLVNCVRLMQPFASKRGVLLQLNTDGSSGEFEHHHGTVFVPPLPSHSAKISYYITYCI